MVEIILGSFWPNYDMMNSDADRNYSCRFFKNHSVTVSFLFFLFVIPCDAQVQSSIKRIKAQLINAKGEQRFTLLNDLAWEERVANPDTAVILARQALELGRTLKLENHLARALNILGVASNYKGDKISAYEYYLEALTVSKTQNDSAEIAYTYNNLGRVFHEKGLLDKAYPNIALAAEIFEKIKDSTGLAYCYQSLGYLHQTQHNFVYAEENYKKALNIRVQLKNQRNIHIGYYLLGRLYTDEGVNEKGLVYLLKADSVGRMQEDKIQLAETWIALARIFLARKDINKADSILTVSLQIIRKNKSVRILSNALLVGAEIASAQGNIRKVHLLLEQALENSKRIGDISTTKDAYFHLWKFHEEQNNNISALFNHNQYLLICDTLKSLDIARQEDELNFERQILNREVENQKLKNENGVIEHRRRSQAWLFALLFIVIVTVGIFMVLYLRKLKIITTQLARKNEMLIQLNQEKDALMSVVAHDLKSPLNKIQGLANLLKMEGQLSANQTYYMGMIDRVLVDGMAFISDLLSVHAFEEERIPQISEFDASEVICRKTSESFHIAKSKDIKLKQMLQPVTVKLDKEYLSRITDNLVSNAIKFSPSHSEVIVSTEKKANCFMLTVEDKGPGFSEQDRKLVFKKFKKLSARPTAGESSNGLGLAIVKTLVDGLGGSIEIDSVVGEGTRIIVRLPLQAA